MEPDCFILQYLNEILLLDKGFSAASSNKDAWGQQRADLLALLLAQLLIKEDLRRFEWTKDGQEVGSYSACSATKQLDHSTDQTAASL